MPSSSSVAPVWARNDLSEHVDVALTFGDEHHPPRVEPEAVKDPRQGGAVAPQALEAVERLVDLAPARTEVGALIPLLGQVALAGEVPMPESQNLGGVVEVLRAAGVARELLDPAALDLVDKVTPLD